MDTSELDSLIVRNLVDLDAAAKRVIEIERRVWRDIREMVADWAKVARWHSEQDGDVVWVAPQSWLDDDGEALAWFEFAWGPGDEGTGEGAEAYFDLSRLSGVAGARLCLWFEYEGIGARAWKPVARGHDAAVREAGFALTDNASIFTDCTPVTETMAEGLANDMLDTALAPLRTALERARDGRKLFEKILKKARAA